MREARSTDSTHIALITTNLAGGGAEKALIRIARQLQQRGHTVKLVLLERHGDHPAPEDIEVHYLYTGRISKGWLGRRLGAFHLRVLIGKLFNHRGPDLVISTLPFADEVAHLARLPNHWCRIANTLSVEVARLSQAQPSKGVRRLSKYQTLYSQCKLVAVSDGVAEDLRHHVGIGKGTPVKVIYNPYDIADIQRQSCAHIDAIPSGPFIVHAGRFSGQKRHDVLLDGYAKLRAQLGAATPSLVLLTHSHPDLVKMIEQRGLQQHVQIAGFQTNPYAWMARAQLLVLSSDHEGLPNVLLEALACGTPVVSTDCPSGPKQILANYPQCLVPCGDAAALATAMATVLQNPPDISQYDFSPYQPDFIAAQWESLVQVAP